MSTVYLTVAEADALAATVPALTAWSAADAAAKTKSLARASADVDAAMPYQGRKFDPAQALQFPRVAYDSPAAPPAAAGQPGAPVPEVVWDWDATTNQAVVPRDVKLAVVYQADAVLAGAREPRLSNQHDGVVYALTGSLAESYKRTTGPGVTTGLSRPAWMLVRKYRVKGGRIL